MNRNKNKFTKYLLTLIFSIGIIWSTSVIFVQAQENAAFMQGQICIPSTDQEDSKYNLARCVNNIYTVSLAIGGFYAVLIFVVAGYMYAFGNEKSVKTARDLISSTVIGLILLFGAFAILNTIDPRLTTFEHIVLLPEVNCDEGRCELPPPPGEDYLIGGACGKTYRTEAEVRPDLVTISYDYYTISGARFDGSGGTKRPSPTKGSVTVNQCIAKRIQDSLAGVYLAQFPIKSIEGQNWRQIAGTNKLSVHSFGVAIDVNPTENGHRKANGTWNPEGSFYRPCSTYTMNCSPYSIPENIANIFKETGLGWGGNWTSSKDYMHFSCAPGEGGNCGN